MKFGAKGNTAKRAGLKTWQGAPPASHQGQPPVLVISWRH